MWKVIVIICALGNPCVIFEEDPVKYYQDYNECMQVAKNKHETLTESFGNYGYSIESSEFKCEQTAY